MAQPAVLADIEGPTPKGGLSRELAYFWYFTRQDRLFLVGLVIVGLSIFLAAFGPYIGPYGPQEIDSASGVALTGPSGDHWFGTDNVGFDVFSRVIAAPRIDLVIALASTALALAIGVPLGAFAGHFGGRPGIPSLLSEALLRVLDVLQAFPIFILALALVSATGASQGNVIAALTFLQAPVFVRLTRGAALSNESKLYVDAARCSGAPERAVAFRHVLPNSLAPALIASSVAVGQAILITAGLSFVGAGVPIPKAEWGLMISQGANQMILGKWWPSLFPGLFLGITVMGYALVGEGLRKFLDPTNRI
ncbi:MAG: ABC transporter permease [Dehalococcoidia bacterium]